MQILSVTTNQLFCVPYSHSNFICLQFSPLGLHLVMVRGRTRSKIQLRESILGGIIDCVELITQWESFRFDASLFYKMQVTGRNGQNEPSTTRTNKEIIISLCRLATTTVLNSGRCKHRVQTQGEAHGQRIGKKQGTQGDVGYYCEKLIYTK